MSEEYGNDFITLLDESGQEFELEYLGDMDYNGESYAAFLPADLDEDDPDYGIVILRCVPGEDGSEEYETIDDDEQLQDVYEHFMVLLFDDEDGEDGE